MASARLDVLEGAIGASSLAVNGGDAQGGGAMAVAMDANGLDGVQGGEIGDDGDGCGSAFRLLRVLVSEWLRDTVSHGSAAADSLLVHFNRWLCARRGLLHEVRVCVRGG